jgi:hypothetical protein
MAEPRRVQEEVPYGDGAGRWAVDPSSSKTTTSANRGRYVETGSSSWKRPSSCRIIAAAAVTAFVME